MDVGIKREVLRLHVKCLVCITEVLGWFLEIHVDGFQCGHAKGNLDMKLTGEDRVGLYIQELMHW